MGIEVRQTQTDDGCVVRRVYGFNRQKSYSNFQTKIDVKLELIDGWILLRVRVRRILKAKEHAT